MIPKIIHFCWLSETPFPEKVQHCINSWKKQLPDYEIRLWNKNSFDFSSVKWTKEALSHKKYAFVSDFIRFYALYHFGGIYLDSDVEVLSSFDSLLNQSFFFGYEYSGLPEAAVIGAEPELPFIKAALEWYLSTSFINSNGTSNAVVAPLILKYFFEGQTGFKLCDDQKSHTFQNGTVFTSDYFSPKNPFTQKIKTTSDTITIHHFNSGWLKKSFMIKLKRLVHIILIKTLGKTRYNRLMYKIRKPLKSAGVKI